MPISVGREMDYHIEADLQQRNLIYVIVLERGEDQKNPIKSNAWLSSCWMKDKEQTRIMTSMRR